MNAARASRDAEELWASLEREDAEPMTLRRFVPAEALAAGTPFETLIATWNSKRVDSLVPDWDAFEFADFRGWHSELIVSVFPDDKPDPEFRIIGESWKIVRNENAVGVRFSEVLPRLFRLQFREHFQAIRDRGLIGLAKGRSPHLGREHVRFQAIELPFRRGGDEVAGLLHGFHLEV